jgi:putative salt-induced outer membrane protein YdiY
MKTALAVLAVVMTTTVLADQVTLKNGDRLTGTIKKMDGKSLTFKSELAGDVTIDWASVTELNSKEKVYVGLKKAQVVEGQVTMTAAELVVESREAGHVTAKREDVDYIRAPDVYEAEVGRYEHPGLLDLWTGFADLGVSLARGNANTATITSSATAVRTTPRDKIEADFTSIYSSSSAGTGVDSVVTANARRGAMLYDLNLRPRMFVFGALDLEYDQFQGLDFRFAPAAGAGYHFIKTDRTILDLRGGVSLDREFFADHTDRTYGEGLVGEEFNHKFTARTSMHEAMVFFPNLSSAGDYRMNFDASAVTAFRRWLGWQFTVSDRLLSNPLSGLKKNDILFSTGFRVTFTK